MVPHRPLRQTRILRAPTPFLNLTRRRSRQGQVPEPLRTDRGAKATSPPICSLTVNSSALTPTDWRYWQRFCALAGTQAGAHTPEARTRGDLRSPVPFKVYILSDSHETAKRCYERLVTKAEAIDVKSHRAKNRRRRARLNRMVGDLTHNACPYLRPKLVNVSADSSPPGPWFGPISCWSDAPRVH
jgi:hypothetical protein